MCGGAILSGLIPRSGNRGVSSSDLWPTAAADFWPKTSADNAPILKRSQPSETGSKYAPISFILFFFLI